MPPSLGLDRLWKSQTGRKAAKRERQTGSQGTDSLSHKDDGNSKSNNGSPGLKPTIEDKILAFRTITMLLSRMHHRREINVDDKQSKRVRDRAEGKKLIIYQALAAIAVMDFEVVSVACDILRTQGLQTNPDWLDDSVGALFTSSQDSAEQLDLEEAGDLAVTKLASSSATPRDSGDSPGFIQKFTQFFTCTLNRYLSTTSSSGSTMTPTNQTLDLSEPSTEDAKRPAKLHSDSDEDLFTFVNKYPNNLGLEERLTLGEHLWVVGRMLSTKTTDISQDVLFLRHVVATCYPKILHWLNHTVGSKPYLNSLREVAKTGFKYGPSAYKPPKSSLSRNLSARETEVKNFDMDFLRYYAIDPNTIGQKIPHIVNKARLLTAGNPIELYDKKTAAEFGILFDYLMDRFESSIWAMDMHRPVVKFYWMERHTKDLKDAYETFEDTLKTAMFVGNALLRLSGGAALPHYLRNVETILEEHNTSLARLMSASKQGLTDEGSNNLSAEQLDEGAPVATVLMHVI